MERKGLELCGLHKEQVLVNKLGVIGIHSCLLGISNTMLRTFQIPYLSPHTLKFHQFIWTLFHPFLFTQDILPYNQPLFLRSQALELLVWVNTIFNKDIFKWERSPSNTRVPSDTQKYISMEVGVRMLAATSKEWGLEEMKQQRGLEDCRTQYATRKTDQMWQYTVGKTRVFGSGSNSHLGWLKKRLKVFKTNFTHLIFF